MEVGTVEGKVNTEQFSFEAHRDVEKFDFVTVRPDIDEADWLLAQVDDVEKEPLDDNEKVDTTYKTVAHASIIGYRHNGLLKKPRSVIQPESIVYQADQQVISDVLGLDSDGLYIGNLITNPDIDIFLDADELYKHIAVLAKTGYGKSYATAVLIEELLEDDLPVIVIDPHGEYNTLSVENDEVTDEQAEKYGIDGEQFPVNEFSPNTDLNQNARQLSFSSRNLEANELQQVVPTNLTNSQLGVLYTALKELKEKDEYTLDQLIDRCMEQESKAKWNLVNMLEAVRDSGLFADDHTDLGSLVQPGQATVINLKGVDPEHQETTVFKLAKELFEKRKHGELQPFIMVIEEAHNFVPEKGMGKAVCSDILRKIASEGRKFGLGIGVISQRPANVAKNILSQCNTQLILRVTNPNDLKAIAKSFEGVTSQVRDSITSLQTGVGLVLGKEYPILTDIRTRKSKHGGGTTDVTLADESAEEPIVSQDEQETEEPPSETVTAFRPSLRQGEAEREYGDIKTVLYPYWKVDTDVGTVIIDGKDGSIVESDLKLTESAEEVLEELDEPLSISDLAERTAYNTETVNQIIEEMVSLDLVERRGDDVQKTSRPLFDAGVDTVELVSPSPLDHDIEEDELGSIVDSELDADIGSVEFIYRIYYRTGDEVVDATTGSLL